MLNKKNLKKYLLEHNLTEDVQKCEVEELSGGIINRIFRAKTEKGVFVLKQFLDKAKIDKNIRLSPKRFFYEKYAINYLDRILDKKITPPIVFFDDKNKIICMKDLGVNNRLDNLMLSNRLKPDVFSKIGKVLAEIHNKSFFNDSLSLLFDNEEFQELKFDYRYYRTMKYSSLIYARDELIQNCRKNKITFIHNDLKINNFFVLDNNKFCLIDYEGSYYGDPAFEVGYLLGHLFVYYFNQPNLRNKKIVLNFWNNYIYSLNFKHKRKLEENVVKHIGFIMIYKLVGISKDDFKFVQSEIKDKIISVSKRIILNKKVKKVNSIFNFLEQAF